MKFPARLRPSAFDFPLGPPSWPGGVPRPAKRQRMGTNYDTSWARTTAARSARALILGGVFRPLLHAVGSPEVHGADRLDGLDEPVIFAANHRSHLDTPLVLLSLPRRWRHETVVAAASDYFFTNELKSAYAALAFGAVPMERSKVSRHSADLAADLLDDGWSLVIFPEGGRSPDGWGQEFRGGAAYLAQRCRRPVVPVYVAGTAKILPKGSLTPKRGAISVTFGNPIRPEAGEHTRRLNRRIEAAVTELGDEVTSDWWSARRRAAQGQSPALTGPDATEWRRAWALEERRRKERGDSTRSWPNF